MFEEVHESTLHPSLAQQQACGSKDLSRLHMPIDVVGIRCVRQPASS